MDYEKEYKLLLEENKKLQRKIDILSAPVTCDICNKVFDLESMIRRHRRQSKICKKASTLPSMTSDVCTETLRHLHASRVVQNSLK